MSRVHFAPAAADEGAAAISAKAGVVLAAALADAGVSDATELRYHFQDHTKRRSEEQFLGWLSPVLDRLRGTGRVLTLQPPGRAAAGERAVTLPDGETVSLSPLVDPTLPLLLSFRPRLHRRSGLSGALHQAAVSCTSAAGRMDLVEGVQPRVERSVCGGCGLCIVHCGNDGVRHNGHVAVINPQTCLACGDCLIDCHTFAVRFPEGGGETLQHRLARAAAALHQDPAPRLYLAFLLREPARHAPNLARDDGQRDLGVLAASDPVALDQAVLELIGRLPDREAVLGVSEDTDPGLLVREAARLGVGAPKPEWVRHRSPVDQ